MESIRAVEVSQPAGGEICDKSPRNAGAPFGFVSREGLAAQGPGVAGAEWARGQGWKGQEYGWLQARPPSIGVPIR